VLLYCSVLPPIVPSNGHNRLPHIARDLPTNTRHVCSCGNYDQVRKAVSALAEVVPKQVPSDQLIVDVLPIFVNVSLKTIPPALKKTVRVYDFAFVSFSFLVALGLLSS
jgi:hypothetical protein